MSNIFNKENIDRFFTMFRKILRKATFKVNIEQPTVPDWWNGSKESYDELIELMANEILKEIREKEDRDYIEKGRYEI